MAASQEWLLAEWTLLAWNRIKRKESTNNTIEELENLADIIKQAMFQDYQLAYSEKSDAHIEEAQSTVTGRWLLCQTVNLFSLHEIDLVLSCVHPKPWVYWLTDGWRFLVKFVLVSPELPCRLRNFEVIYSIIRLWLETSIHCCSLARGLTFIVRV